MAQLFSSSKELKKSVHSRATDLFFRFFRREKSKSEWVDYFLSIPLADESS